MKQVILSSIAVSFLAAGCSSSPLAKDLESFCKVAAEVDRQSSLSNEQKLQKIDGRKNEYARAPSTVWSSLASLSGEAKYNQLLTTAREAGKSDWSCNQYKRIAIGALVEQRAAEERAAKKRAELESKSADLATVKAQPNKSKRP